MRRKLLCICVSLTVPLFLYMNVWQSFKYKSSYFEITELIATQERVVDENNRLLNRVAELQSPAVLLNTVQDISDVVPMDKDDVVRIEVVPGE